MYWTIAICFVITVYCLARRYSRSVLLPRLPRLLSIFLSSYYTLNTTHGPDPTVATAVLLLHPLPWRLPLPPPLPRSSLTPATIADRQRHIHALRINRLFGLRDTPLRSLYRMWELTGTACCARNERALKEETTYFFYQSSWQLCDIPDPADEDAVRYAWLASLVERLVEVVNKRVRFGLRRDRMHPGIEERRRTRANSERWLESAPGWVERVKGVDSLWVFPQGVEHVKEMYCEPGLLKRGIKRDKFSMHFI